MTKFFIGILLFFSSPSHFSFQDVKTLVIENSFKSINSINNDLDSNRYIEGREVLRQKRKDPRSATWPYIITGLLVIVLIIIAWKQIKNKLDNHTKKRLNYKEGEREYYHQNLNNLQKKIKKLERELDELKKENSELKASNERINKEEELNKGKSAIIAPNLLGGGDEDPNHLKKIKERNIYFSTPHADGHFNDNNKSERYEEGKSLYQLNIQSNNENEAQFILCAQFDSIKRALSNPKENIYIVCEQLNSYNQEAASIKTEIPGTVRFEDGKWKLKSPAKIRFI